jgi:hypothetical protein
VTLITFQGGNVVLRDGLVGTEQACCCGGVCDSTVGDCNVFACGEYPDGGTPYYFQPTEQDAQDTGDSWVADFEPWAASIDLVQSFIDAGYVNVTTGGSASAYPVTECGYDPIVEGQEWGWTATWAFSADCLCPGGIDYEAEPTVIWDPNGELGQVIDSPDYPPVTPDGGCFDSAIAIYPCNPLP